MWEKMHIFNRSITSKTNHSVDQKEKLRDEVIWKGPFEKSTNGTWRRCLTCSEHSKERSKRRVCEVKGNHAEKTLDWKYALWEAIIGRRLSHWNVRELRSLTQKLRLQDHLWQESGFFFKRTVVGECAYL